MTSLPLVRPVIPFELRRPLLSLAAAAAVTVVADWLFYVHAPGISVAIFAVALAGAALLSNPVRASASEFGFATALLALALLPSIEDFGLLSLAFAIAGTAVFVLLATGWHARPPAERLRDIGWIIVSGPVRLVDDVASTVGIGWDRELAKHGATLLNAWIVPTAWIVPLALGAVFVLLFALANPLIDNWLIRVDPSSFKLDPLRPLFWLAVIAAVWPFLRVQLWSKPTTRSLLAGLGEPLQPPAGPHPDLAVMAEAREGALFGRTAILRSLFLFNALFMVQSALDIAYLWGGVALPAGMSYASYAHRGVYPLMATALLAGAFVLAAMRPGTSTERSRVVTALVFVWVGQNVLLVLSSMLRLHLYVDVYLLTAWRCAAFIWMLLVAVGLVLIVARIVLARSNTWLVWANAAVLALTLYGCSLTDFSAQIADFNVAHSREVTGVGEPVDVGYLCQLGPSALPALAAFAKVRPASWPTPEMLAGCRSRLAMLARQRMQDWRAWTWRGDRLLRFLDRENATIAADPLGSVG